MAPRLDLRCQSDADLEQKLLADPDVKRVVEELDKKPDLGARRHLLATSVRVTQSMSPRLDALMTKCRETLGVETPVETYVYPDATFNAGCVRPEHGRVFVLLSSALLEAFDDEELRFVIGHELGHHLFQHHRLPVKLLAGEEKPGPVAMTLFAWSRFAEVSADRAGLVCAGSLEPVGRSLFKLASGLKGGLVQMRADDLLAQIGDMRAELQAAASSEEKPRGDWFATHPFSPLRLHAAKFFALSSLFTGGAGSGREQLEAEVSDLMSLMEPTYLSEKSEAAELMRRLLLAGGVAVASASGDIDAKEKAALDKFFGAGTCERLNVEALRADLARRAADVKAKVTPLKRQQVVRDLCVIALADGRVAPAERALLLELAANAGVEATLVERTLAAAPVLD